jgi:hypothetical protein
MLEKKKRILVVPSDTSGVGKYRSIDPHLFLEKKYPEKYHVDIDYSPQLDSDDFLKKYNIIHYHRTLGSYEGMEELLNRLDSMGVKTIMDIDDYWSPGQHHPIYLIIKNNKLDEKILNNIRLARNITTTTETFANEIRKINKNVFVIPNAIDDTEPQFTPNLEKSERLRIGYLAGSSHLKDVELMGGLVNKLKSDGLMNKLQFVLCGYDLRGIMTTIDPKTGKQTQRKIKPEESVWYKYEKIFTDNYTTVSEKYKNHLLTFEKGEYDGVENEPYRRVWTKPITTYGTSYNLFDVSLAPLEDNMFNRVKSNLKVVEAGFHKKVLIAQDLAPYNKDITHAYNKGGEFNVNGNGFLVSKNHKDWYKYIKFLINNPSYVDVISNNLHNTVKNKFSLDVVSGVRAEVYNNL